jgi:hypothetical protein
VVSCPWSVVSGHLPSASLRFAVICLTWKPQIRNLQFAICNSTSHPSHIICFGALRSRLITLRWRWFGFDSYSCLCYKNLPQGSACRIRGIGRYLPRGFGDLSFARESAGVRESMKSQIPSTKYQTNLKFQYSMTKTGLVRRRRIGHCDLFVIRDLCFGTSDTLVLQNRWTCLPAKPLKLDLAKMTSFSLPEYSRIGENITFNGYDNR